MKQDNKTAAVGGKKLHETLSPEMVRRLRTIRRETFILLFLTGFYTKNERQEQAEEYLNSLVEETVKKAAEAQAGAESDEDLAELEPEFSAELAGEIMQRYHDVAAQIGKIDPMISRASHGWDLNRIGKAELNIMRVAAYEMYFDESVPVAVAVDEAVEAARTFGGEQSPAFVNGILSEILKANKLPEGKE
ncbi:MAG: transcription antitermination factor NusB [Lachnospiraceae bacterium]|nr:transcription antitermination factor NusB [Lachnospiraceae bacterium]